MSVRQQVIAFAHSGDAHVALDLVVIRRDISIADRPILAKAVVRRGLEIEIAQAIALPAPDIGSAANHTHAAEVAVGHVLGSRVRFVVIVGEPLIIPLGAGVALSLNGPRLLDDRRNGFAKFHIAVGQVVNGYMLGEVDVGLRPAAIEHKDMGAAFREHFRRPTPGCARANHNDIVLGFGHHFDDILLVVGTIRDSEFSRRDWMLVLLETTSILSVAMPAAAAQHDTHATATSGETAAAAWTPRFLSTEQNETLIALGERVIPGSEEAQCNRLIDSILAIDSEKNKRELVQALAAFDNKAMQLHQRQQFRTAQLCAARSNPRCCVAKRQPVAHRIRDREGMDGRCILVVPPGNA